MGLKEEIISSVMAIADDSNDINIIAALGSFGRHLRLAHGKIVESGMALNENEGKQVLPTVIGGIAAFLDGSGTFSSRKVKNIAGSYQMEPTDQIIQIYGTLSSNITITLPPIADVNIGKSITVKDKGAIVAGVATVSVAGSSGQSIDDATSFLMAVKYSCLNLYSDGERWLISSSK